MTVVAPDNARGAASDFVASQAVLDLCPPWSYFCSGGYIYDP